MQKKSRETKILLPGGAGLVGQNLIVRLKRRGFTNIIALDKHEHNLNVLKKLHPDVTAVLADLSQPGSWQEYFKDAGVVIMLQAQIGGIVYDEFVKNNVTATQNILNILKSQPQTQLVHISSSVVNSVADDFYTQTKKEQEQLVAGSGVSCPILRPTLMFGWFDRKHLGWLARFMKRVPVFPIPGNGKFLRQPLFVGDFCDIIISCIESDRRSGVYNISGREYIDYIDIIRAIKKATGSSAILLKLPYKLFYFLLWLWSQFDKDPPFTTQQLEALVAKDEFEIINWPEIFSVQQTSFSSAVDQTFKDPQYSQVFLEF